jgi:TRAP-type C4-dicarboxylate transport system permease small subunit
METRRLMDAVERGINGLSLFGEILAEIATCVLALVVITGVLLTYVLTYRDVFSVEISGYLLVFICFASVAYILREKRHVVVDALLILLTPKTRLKFELVASILTFVFCCILIWEAADVTILNYQRGFRSASLVTMPLWIPYLVIALGALALALQGIVQIRGLTGRIKGFSGSSEGK